MLNVYLFHGYASHLPFAWYTILLSGILYVGTSNCFMSTCFTINFFTFWYILCGNV